MKAQTLETKIKDIYLGTWFQRTSLHLFELYNFLNNKNTIKDLDSEKLKSLRKALNVKSVRLHEESRFYYLEANCSDVEISITEDGIILMSPVDDKNRQALENFYTHKFGPAISYLFSKGAPLPKELSKVESLYPVMFLTSSINEQEAQTLLRESGDELISIAKSQSLDIYYGHQVNVFNLNKKILHESMTEFLRNLVFFRDVEDQLNNYLQSHRDMWEEVSNVRESRVIKYREFPNVRQKLLDYLEVLSFVKARLAQIEDTLEARQSLMTASVEAALRSVGLDRFQQLKTAQRYIMDIWQMTIEYVDGTSLLLESLQRENAERELTALKFVTFGAVLTGFFGMNIAFPWEERWPQVFQSSLFVVLLILVISYIFYLFLKVSIYDRKFIIRNKQKK